jgi:hypothetical protein
MGEPEKWAAEWWMRPVRMKVNDRSAGRQCDGEGVIELYIMLVLGTVLLLCIFKNTVFCGINERRSIIIIIIIITFM